MDIRKQIDIGRVVNFILNAPAKEHLRYFLKAGWVMAAVLGIQ